MSSSPVPSRLPLLASRWIARLLSLAVIAIIIAFLGEGTPKPKEWLLIAFFPIGLLVGLVLSWWREIVGALVAIASMAGLYAISFALSGKVPTGPYFELLASPALFFLIAGVLSRSGGGVVPVSPRRA